MYKQHQSVKMLNRSSEDTGGQILTEGSYNMILISLLFQYELVAELFTEKAVAEKGPTRNAKGVIIRAARELPDSRGAQKAHKKTVGSQVWLSNTSFFMAWSCSQAVFCTLQQ